MSEETRPLRIVVVCTANICRSPMGMGLLRARIAADGLSDQVEVVSRGVQALEGYGAAPLTKQLMAERGVDLSSHSATALTSADVRDAAMIFVMEDRHRRAIVRHWPESSDRVRMWLAMGGVNEDVDDPYPFGRAEYAHTLSLLEQALEAGWPALRHELGLAPHAPAPDGSVPEPADADPAEIGDDRAEADDDQPSKDGSTQG
jgi:protein-tyrosine phosphatase